MLSKAGARHIRDFYNAEVKASAPAPLAPVAPAEALAAPLANPPFDLSAMLAAHGYAGFASSCRPSYQQVEAARKRIKAANVPLPWIGARQLAFVKEEWDAASVPVDVQFLEQYTEAASQLGTVNPTTSLNHMVLVKSSALARTAPWAAVWMASTAVVVHAMVVAGCFGDQGCLRVAVTYLGVFADIAAKYDYVRPRHPLQGGQGPHLHGGRHPPLLP